MLNNNIPCGISPEGWKSVKAGNAYPAKGGIKSLDGKFLELYKPNVNNLNSIDTNNLLEKISSNQNLIQQLSFLNVALTAANIGICAIGFAKTLKMLQEVSQKLDRIEEKIDRIEAKLDAQYKCDYENLIRDIKIEYGALSENTYDSFKNEAPRITKLIEKGFVKLKDLCDKFNNGILDGNLVAEMIFHLLLALTMLVQLFTTQCYYEYNKIPQFLNLDEWLSIIKVILNNDFKRSFKNYIDLNHANIPIEDRITAYNFVHSTVTDIINKIELNTCLLTQMPKSDYYRLPEILQISTVGSANGINQNTNEP